MTVSFKKSCILSGLIVLVLSLVACGSPKDTKAPVITSVDVEDGTIYINASDDNVVKAYMVTESTTKPSSTSTSWSSGINFKVEAEGIYYAWAKDEAGNISEPKEVVVEIETIFERLAKDFDHIAWVINPATEKTVDGVTYNLTELKQKYGILYPMVEPLSEQEIKDRWKYLVNYLVEEASQIRKPAYEGGLIVEPLSSKTEEAIDIQLYNYNKLMYNAKELTLNRFSKIYKYSEALDRYYHDYPDTLKSSETVYGVGRDIINEVPLIDMEWFVRHYTISTYISINEVIKQKEPEENIQFWFDSQLSKSK